MKSNTTSGGRCTILSTVTTVTAHSARRPQHDTVLTPATPRQFAQASARRARSGGHTPCLLACIPPVPPPSPRGLSRSIIPAVFRRCSFRGASFSPDTIADAGTWNCPLAPSRRWLVASVRSLPDLGHLHRIHGPLALVRAGDREAGHLFGGEGDAQGQ